MPRPDIVHTVADLRARVSSWRSAGESVALAPTMGALHAGHVALAAAARAAADRLVVSIFVNPTQFAPHEDLANYPRTLGADLDTLSAADVDLVFAPDVAEMYPEGDCTAVHVGGPSAGLESDARPHFFGGVATVVAKLLNQCTADVAVFGEKDFQQLAVVRRMARDLMIQTEIRSVPTVREPDGLALSSRNVYLGREDRIRAPALHAALATGATEIARGGDVAAELSRARRALQGRGFRVDYVELRDEATLAPIAVLTDRPGRLLAAARLGDLRLIDNVPVTNAR